MKSLTYRQAAGCENATSPKCRCRCGGAYHGAGRGEVVALPAGDPHAVDHLPADVGDGGVQLALFDPPSNLDRLAELRRVLADAQGADPGPKRTNTHRPASRRLERRSDGYADDGLEVAYAY